jgi:hypothetical protein
MINQSKHLGALDNGQNHVCDGDAPFKSTLSMTMWIGPVALLLFAVFGVDIVTDLFKYATEARFDKQPWLSPLDPYLKAFICVCAATELVNSIRHFIVGGPTLERDTITGTNGFFRCSSFTLDLHRIVSVEVHEQYPHERLFNSGAVKVTTSTGRDVYFAPIHDPQGLRDHIAAKLISA